MHVHALPHKVQFCAHPVSTDDVLQYVVRNMYFKTVVVFIKILRHRATTNSELYFLRV